MRFAILLFGFVQIFAINSFAQCSEQDETRALLIGDSWAFFMGVDGTLNEVFERWGHSNVKFYTNVEVAVNGARTTDFLEPNMQTEIRNIINNTPDIDVVHLSIAGNDVLGQWDVNFTQAELDDLVDEVYGQTDSIIRFLKTLKPGIKVVFSGYVYPNFEEVLVDNNPLGNAHPFYGTWSGMGFPSFLQINSILNDFSELIEDYAAADPQVEFFKVPGLLQYTFGQTTPLAVAPGGSYPPFTQSLPFGDPSYPSPQNSMRDYFGITRDCFHLSPQGYRDLISYHTQKFYHKFFMDDQYLFNESNFSGSVSNLQNTSNELKIGQESGEIYQMLIDFNTNDLMWGEVEAAELFLQIENISGNNPLNTELEIGIVTGSFGSSRDLDPADWNAATEWFNAPCVFGNTNDVGRWVRIKIPADAVNAIPTNAPCQLLIQSTNTSDGFIRFNNTSDPDFSPVLNIKFDENYVGIKAQDIASNITVFPNPSEDYIYLKSEPKILSVLVLNLLGQEILEIKNSENINISGLPAGNYYLRIETKKGFAMKSFIKK